MGTKKELIGQTFGKLVVVAECKKRNSSGSVIWECLCQCGRKLYIPSEKLTKKDGTRACMSCAKKGWKNPRKDRTPIKCLNCGTVFEVIRSRVGVARFCSARCGAKYNYDPNVFTMKGKKPWNKRADGVARRLSRSVSQGIRHSIKKEKSGHHWEDLVGYTVEELKKHIEKKFKDGMSWCNYGEWHIDHIIPISAFNFSTYSHSDFKRCWALKNLQPLWAAENSLKNNNLIQPFQPHLKI